MAGSSDYKLFATAGGADVVDQATYEADPALSNGFTTGTAESDRLNKVWRQGSAGSALLGKFIADMLGIHVIDDGDLNALVANFEKAVQTYTGRARLLADTDFYVSTTGNDSNPGTQILPWRTLQHAWDSIQGSVDPGSHVATVHVAPGSYAPFHASGSVASAPASSVVFVGDTVTPSNCTISASNTTAVWADLGANLTIRGFRLTATGSGGAQGWGILLGSGGFVACNFIEFGACTNGGISGQGGGLLTEANAALFIIGASGSFINSSGPGPGVNIAGATVTLESSPTFTGATFMIASNGAFINRPNVTWTGGAGGATPQYSVSGNAILAVSGGSWPTGLTAGSTSTGGQVT